MNLVFRTHLRLMLRTGLVWLTLALVALAIPWANVGLTSAVGLLSRVLYYWVPVSVLLYMVMGIEVAQREVRAGLDELVSSLPVTNTGWLLGRFAALLATAGLIQTAQLLMALAAGLALTGSTVPGGYLLGAWGAMLVAALVSATIGYVAGLFTRRMLGPVFLCVLVMLVLVFLLRGSPVLLTDFTTSGFSGLALHTLGYFPNQALVALSHLLWAGISLTLLALSLWFWKRQRGGGRPAPFRLGALLLIGLLATGFAGGAAGRVLAARRDSYAAEARAFAAPEPPGGAAAAGYLASAYAIDLAFQPASHGVTATARVTLHGESGAKTGQELLFTLRPNLALSGIDGAAGFERTGPFVQVRLAQPPQPGEPVTLTFHYQGTVYQWQRDYLQGMAGGLLANHVTPESLTLAGNYGWYPMLGAHPLAWSRADGDSELQEGSLPPWERTLPNLRDLPVWQPPVQFRLTVSGWEKPLFTNLAATGPNVYEGEVSLPWLMGGDLVAVRGEQADAVVPEGLAPAAQKWLRYRTATIRTLEGVVPRAEPGPLRFITTGSRSAFSLPAGQYGEPLVAPGAVALPNAGERVGDLPQISVLAGWWTAYADRPGPDRNQVELALGVLMARQLDPRDPYAAWVQANARSQADQDRQLLALVDQLYVEKGAQGTTELLRHLYRLSKERALTPDDLMAAAR